MSFFEVVGTSPFAAVLPALLGIGPDSRFPVVVPRLRDAYLIRKEGNLYVHMLTRLGRLDHPQYTEVIDRLRAHANYVRDWTEPLDPAFIMFEFLVPETLYELFDFVYRRQGFVATAAERVQQLQNGVRDESNT